MKQACFMGGVFDLNAIHRGNYLHLFTITPSHWCRGLIGMMTNSYFFSRGSFKQKIFPLG